MSQMQFDDPRSLEARFRVFHAANPHVYVQLRSLALAARRRGVRRIGIGQLFEVLRWNTMLRTRGNEFKLNNDFRAPYARLLMASDPFLAGMFETRRSRVDEAS